MQAPTKNRHWDDPCTECAPMVQWSTVEEQRTLKTEQTILLRLTKTIVRCYNVNMNFIVSYFSLSIQVVTLGKQRRGWDIGWREGHWANPGKGSAIYDFLILKDMVLFLLVLKLLPKIP